MKVASLMLLCLGCLLVVVPLSSATPDWSADSGYYPGHGPGGWTPQRPWLHSIPHVIFHDADDPYEMVDMDDIFDNDMDTGDTMIAMPRHWNLTFRDVNEAAASCRDLYCRRYEACIVGDDRTPACQCPTASVCEGLRDQTFCAGNGLTYTNRCLLRVDECAANRLIRIFYRGPCRQGFGGRRRFLPPL